MFFDFFFFLFVFFLFQPHTVLKKKAKKKPNKTLPLTSSTTGAKTVSLPSEAGAETSIRISPREDIQWQAEKKGAIIYVSTSAMWEDNFIDILMIILDHSPLHSSTAIQHTLVSSRARPTSHLSGRRNWVRVDIKIKDAWREKPRRADRACQAMFVSKHDLQKGKWVPLGAWEVWLCEK